MSKAALLVLDMQNELIAKEGKVGGKGFHRIVEERSLVSRVRRLLDAFRAKGLPVVFVRVGFRADYLDAISRSDRLHHLKEMKALVLGTHGTGFPAEIAPLESELVVTKRAVSPFHNTPLLNWLNRQGVTELVLTGVYTHMVVDSTARYADDSGFVVTVLEDCCASPDMELHRVVIEKVLPLFGKVTTSDELLAREAFR